MAFIPSDKHILVNYHYVRNPSADWGGIHPCPVAEFDRQKNFYRKIIKLFPSRRFIHQRGLTREKGSAPLLSTTVCVINMKTRHRFLKIRRGGDLFVITRTLSGEVPDAHKMHIVNSKMG